MHDVAYEYCRFGKRDLDKTSWLAPLLNNKFGDALNLELRHEQLFFIRGNEVLDNVGYSEKGTRFNEADFGKPIHTLDDLRNAGYWLTGRIYDPQVMREALARQKDGLYYSIFSNQCQDWADRLRKKAVSIEKEWGLEPQQVLKGLPPEQRKELTAVQRVPPTEPASLGMGIMAVLLGIAAMFAPIFFASKFALLLGLFFVASGVSHGVYAFKGRDTHAAVPILLSALLYFLGGCFVLINREAALTTASILIAGTLGFQGGMQMIIALFSRPLVNWLATFAAGLAMLICSLLVFLRWPSSTDQFLGFLVGFSLISGGFSTVYLSQRTRNEMA